MKLMNVFSIAIILMTLSGLAQAQTPSTICVKNGSNCVPVGSSSPLPIGVYGGSSGQVLTSNGTGSATFQAAGGSGSPGGTNGQIQYNNSGSFGGFFVGGDSTLNATTGVMVNTGINGTPVTTSLATGALTVTSSSANAFAVGQTGVTSPAFNVDSSIATSVTGVDIQSNVAGSGVTLIATSTGTNETLNVEGKGTGPLNLIGGSGQGVINLAPIQGGATRLSLSGTVANWGTLINFIFNPNTVSNTAATVRYSVLDAADAALTAGAEAPHTYWNIGSQIRTHASNTIIALQRDFRITGTTHAFATAGGVITNAAAFSVDGPASGGTNATLTNSSGIYVPTTALTNVTNGYGLNVAAPTGATATNNIALFQSAAGTANSTFDGSANLLMGSTAVLGQPGGSLVFASGAINVSESIVPNQGVSGRTLRFTNNTGSVAEGFEFFNTTLSTSLMKIQQNGSVGIGSAIPSGNLDVYGPSTNVDGISLVGGVTGTPGVVTIQPVGSDANININILSKGTGVLGFNGAISGSTITAPRFYTTSSVAGAGGNTFYLPAANTPGIAANGLLVASFLPTTTSVDNLTFKGSATGTPGVVSIGAAGTDAAISIQLSPLGTGKVQITGLTTGSNADFLCTDGTGNILEQASACTISQRKLKENFVEVSGVAAVDDLMALKPTQFNFKAADNGDPNADKTQYGFIAEEVAAVDPKLSIYENDMKTPKSYRQEAMISLLVKGFQEHQKELEAITGNKMVVVGHKCFFNILVCAE